MIGPIVVIIVLGLVVPVVAWLNFRKRRAAQLAAHEARLRAMTQTYLAAARKKKAAEEASPNAAANTATEITAPRSTFPRDERECPFCAEPILKKAKVCKHCHRDVEPLER